MFPSRSNAMDSVLAALNTSKYSQTVPATGGPAAHRPFITISRQAGVGGRSIGLLLVERLNAVDTGGLPWTLWDNEIVQKVVAEQHLPEERVRALEEYTPTWFEECLTGLALAGPGDAPDELVVYHRVAAVIRSLAELGHVVIVGRGGAFITEGLKGGVHLRLVAPIEYRIARTAQVTGARAETVAATLRETDERRAKFYRRHWPKRHLDPAAFTVTYNTATVPTHQLILSILPLVLRPLPVGQSAAEAGVDASRSGVAEVR